MASKRGSDVAKRLEGLADLVIDASLVSIESAVDQVKALLSS